MHDKIPVSVLIVTKNEEHNLARCLSALESFDEVVVIDSNSADSSKDIALSFGADVVNFTWNGGYPKKRQWCLDNIPLKHERVFFVDADEEVTPAQCAEIKSLDWKCDGYFVKGSYVVNKKPLQFGLKNKKLCLFDRRTIEFPIVNDLDIPGMGEIEGHYQPVFKANTTGKIGALKNPLLHHATENPDLYADRHAGYAQWEKEMRARKAYPREPQIHRRVLKKIFSMMPFRAAAAFAHSYVFMGGFLDGYAGYVHAKNRYRYYKSIEASNKEMVRDS